LTVTGTQQALRLTQSGLTFLAVQGGLAPPPLSFSVFNEGASALSWTAAASTISGGSWLTVTPASGSATVTQGAEAQVRVNPAGLAPGDYYGQVEVRAAGASNSPQVVAVVMNVVRREASPGPVVSPTGLIFVGRQGEANPPAQTVLVNLLDNVALSYNATTTTTASSTNRFAVQPSTGNVSGAEPARLSVTANLTAWRRAPTSGAASGSPTVRSGMSRCC
jgi:hypothetical protein